MDASAGSGHRVYTLVNEHFEIDSNDPAVVISTITYAFILNWHRTIAGNTEAGLLQHDIKPREPRWNSIGGMAAHK